MGVDCFNKPEKITKKRRGGRNVGFLGFHSPATQAETCCRPGLMKDRAMKDERWPRCGVRLASLVLPKN